jgi:hypothetical protein
MQTVQQTVTDNIFHRSFHALELYNWLHERFPESFCMKIYTKADPQDNRNNEFPVWDFDKQRKGPGGFHKLKFPEPYWIDADGAEFHHFCGGENSYIRLTVYDKENKPHIVSFGYKRCMTPGNYALELITILLTRKPFHF